MSHIVRTLAPVVLGAALVFGLGARADRHPAADSNPGGPPTAPDSVPLESQLLGGRNILVYTTFLDDLDELNNVLAILHGAGASTTMVDTASPAVLFGHLVAADCFLIPEQFGGSFHDFPDPELDQLQATFQALRPAINRWMRGGGRVVLLEGDLSSEPGAVIARSIAITQIASSTESTGLGPLAITAPADPLMAGISAIAGANGDQTFTSRDGLLEPIVTLPGNASEMVVARKRELILIGFDYHAFAAEHAQLLVNACL